MRFTVDTALPPAPAPGWGEGPPSHKGSSLFAGGLHISTGAIVDPNGRTWVADHNGGFCRVTPADRGRRRARSTTRRSPGDPGARTCLGGLHARGRHRPRRRRPAGLRRPDAETCRAAATRWPSSRTAPRPSSDVVRAAVEPRHGPVRVRGHRHHDRRPHPPGGRRARRRRRVYVVFQRLRHGAAHRQPRRRPRRRRRRHASPTAAAPAASPPAATRAAARSSTSPRTPASRSSSRTRSTRRWRAPRRSSWPPARPRPARMAYDLKRDHLYVGTADGTVVGADVVHRVQPATGGAELRLARGLLHDRRPQRPPRRRRLRPRRSGPAGSGRAPGHRPPVPRRPARPPTSTRTPRRSSTPAGRRSR